SDASRHRSETARFLHRFPGVDVAAKRKAAFIDRIASLFEFFRAEEIRGKSLVRDIIDSHIYHDRAFTDMIAANKARPPDGRHKNIRLAGDRGQIDGPRVAY